MWRRCYSVDRHSNITFAEHFGETFNSAVDMSVRLFENIHSFTGLPWWANIVGMTLGVRIALLPVKIRAIRSQASLQLIRQEMAQAIVAIQRDTQSTKATIGERSHKEWKRLIAKHQAHPVMSLLPAATYLPVFLLFSSALRKMSAVPWPFMSVGVQELSAVDGFKDQGLLWFANLSVPDPRLAIVVAVSNFALVEILVRRFNREAFMGSRLCRTVYYGLHVANFFTLSILWHLPSALNLYVLVSNALTLGEASLLRLPRIRRLVTNKASLVY